MPLVNFAHRSDKTTTQSATGAELVNCYAQSSRGEGDESQMYVYVCAGARVVNFHIFVKVQIFNGTLWGVKADGQLYQDVQTYQPGLVAQLPHAGTDWYSCATRDHLVMGVVGDIPTTITKTGALEAADLTEGVSSVTVVSDAVIYAMIDSDRFWLSDGSNAPAVQDTSFATAQVRDDVIRRTVTIGETVLLLGDNTIEQWYVNRDANFPLAPYTNGVSELGIANARTFAQTPNAGAWLTRDLQVYIGVGRDSKPISTRAIHEFLEENRPNVLANAYMTSYAVSGRWFIVLTVPDLITLEYDVAEGLWHSRTTADRKSWQPVDFAHVNGETYWFGAEGVRQVTLRDPTESGLAPRVRMQSQMLSTYETQKDTLDYLMFNFDKVQSAQDITLTVQTDTATVVRDDLKINANERLISRNFGTGRQFRVELSFQPTQWMYLRSSFAQLGRGEGVGNG